MKKIASIIFASIFIFSCNSSRNITTINKPNSIFLDNIESGSNLKLDKGTYELDYPIKILGKENITIDGNGATLIMRNEAYDVIYVQNSKNITLMNFKINESDILSNQDWTFPTNIAYGPGRLKEIGSICNGLNIKNPLIVTDKGSPKLPFVINLQSYLSNSNVKSDLFFDISPNPREDEVSVGCKKYKDGNHDAIIAIGGGSAMDGGKLICLTANNDVPLRDFEFELTPPKISKNNPFPKIITIPTTAGTGAETEITAMVTYLKEGMKFCMWHPDVRPSLALIDPELTIGLPSNLTAWTGADALIHGIEGYCVPGFNPMCDGAALEGLSLISKSLITAVEEPSNLVARGGMHVGSCF